jgi:hypothetical protein
LVIWSLHGTEPEFRFIYSGIIENIHLRAPGFNRQLSKFLLRAGGISQKWFLKSNSHRFVRIEVFGQARTAPHKRPAHLPARFCTETPCQLRFAGIMLLACFGVPHNHRIRQGETMRVQPMQFFNTLVRVFIAALLVLAALPGHLTAQQNNAAVSSSAASLASSTVPQIIQFSGTLGGSASVPSGTVSITFTLYENEQGGTALWSETDNVQVDGQGHYTALLGSASPEGLPMNLFATVQANWLAVQPLLEGFGEQPRVLLVSAPYALKAGDAETIGGLPPSAFARATPGTSSSSGASGSAPSGSFGGPTGQPLPPTLSGSGIKNYIPIWTSASKLGDSVMYQTGGNVGIGTTTPVATLEVNGTAQFDNTVTFTPGQTFPGTGTITGVTAGTGLSGGGTSGSVTLSLASNACGAGNALTALPFTCSPFASLGGNTFTGNQTITGNLTASGTVTGAVVNATTSFDLGGTAFAFGSSSTENAFLGFAGNTTTTGAGNTASGAQALSFNTTGSQNTATGYEVLINNTTWSYNTASGQQALYSNTTGNTNTASGQGALTDNTTGSQNTASGAEALFSNTTGSDNTATGYEALESSTTASGNTATGFDALVANTTAGGNTATGYEALFSNTTGGNNTASGSNVLFSNTKGSGNTASGASALYSATTGNNSTAIGFEALTSNTTGSNNIAIGYIAALNVSGGNSNNIHIGNSGASGDNGVIRIGADGNQTSFFAAGVYGVTTGDKDAIPVLIDSKNQLGTVSSSRRYKEEIQDMGNASEGLMRLRPVTFRYKKPFDDGSKPIQYGLIAEEVAEVYPDLVARSADGQIETVKYQLLDPMLLNEVQRQHAEAQLQQAKIRALEDRVKTQLALLKTQQAQVAELASQMKIIQASLRTRRAGGHARLASAKGTPAPATTDPTLPLAPSVRGGN